MLSSFTQRWPGHLGSLSYAWLPVHPTILSHCTQSIKPVLFLYIKHIPEEKEGHRGRMQGVFGKMCFYNKCSGQEFVNNLYSLIFLHTKMDRHCCLRDFYWDANIVYWVSAGWLCPSGFLELLQMYDSATLWLHAFLCIFNLNPWEPFNWSTSPSPAKVSEEAAAAPTSVIYSL